MKAPTLFLFFFATLSSLAFAQPLQRRNFDDFYGCLLQLSLKIGVFNHYVSTNSVLLEVGGLLVSYQLYYYVLPMLISARVFWNLFSAAMRNVTPP